ncbi:MAG TPA: methyltransferase domain-containing protein [Ktedonobacterales bacterium]|nr:methyltransferase domain-containing protein [Ktedonobacterales bacterium]
MDTQQTPSAAYVLGHSAQELERLIAQSRLFEPFTEQFFREAGVTTGMRVLDFGCGAGDVSFLVARMVGPTGQVIGLDRSPDGVATASRRARSLAVSNVRFVQGEVGTLADEEPFDAAVGRFVLMFCPDPVDVLRQVTARICPGGLIAFQEADWTDCRSSPDTPTWSQCVRWATEAFQQSGADTLMGLKLAATYATAGLPAPTLSLHAGIAAGPNHPLYTIVSETIRTLLPAMEQLGIATAGEVDIDTLARRLSDELDATQGTAIWFSLIGAAARKPKEQE